MIEFSCLYTPLVWLVLNISLQYMRLSLVINNKFVLYKYLEIKKAKITLKKYQKKTNESTCRMPFGISG